jgi:NitT/TauT family transport system ATP-binding protein
MASVEFKNVSVTYRGADGGTTALRDVSISVEDGEPVSVIGPSGCGKSTLLMMADGMLRPTSGSVLVDGEPIERPRQATAFIPQDLGLLAWKTVEKNVELGLKVRGLPKAERRERTRAAIKQVGLAGFERSYPAELSGGMRQRVAFARAIALDADLLLADEPLSALDAISREALQRQLLDVQRTQGCAAILVTHSIDEAVLLGRRVVVMTRRPGTVAGVIDNPGWGDSSYRFTDEFNETGRRVRRLLERVMGEGCEEGGAREQDASDEAGRPRATVGSQAFADKEVSR